MIEKLTAQTVAIVSAYVSRQGVGPDDLIMLVRNVYQILVKATEAEVEAERRRQLVKLPAPTPEQIRQSIRHTHLISFENGQPYQSLRRHLRKLGLTPETYREKWSLPADYPMVARGLSRLRSQQARAARLETHMRTLLLTLGASAVMAVPALAIQLPTFVKGTHYSEVRAKLILSGYDIFPFSIKDDGDSRCAANRQAVCDGFRETRFCTTGTRGRCEFVLRYFGKDLADGEKGVLGIETSGLDADPRVDRLRFLSDGEIAHLLAE